MKLEKLELALAETPLELPVELSPGSPRESYEAGENEAGSLVNYYFGGVTLIPGEDGRLRSFGLRARPRALGTTAHLPRGGDGAGAERRRAARHARHPARRGYRRRHARLSHRHVRRILRALLLLRLRRTRACRDAPGGLRGLQPLLCPRPYPANISAPALGTAEGTEKRGAKILRALRIRRTCKFGRDIV